MSDPGSALVGALARTSAVGLAAMLIVAILERRRRPESAVMAARAGLIGLVLAAGLSLVPWPDRYRLALPVPPGAPVDAPAPASPVAAVAPLKSAGRAIPTPDPTPGRSAAADRIVREPAGPPARAPSGTARPALRPRVKSGIVGANVPEKPRWDLHWSTWATTALIAGWVLGAARLASGLVAMSRGVARSDPVEDPGILAIVGEIHASLGISRCVAIRESDASGLPATLGWLRPCIMLPRGWRGWSAEEARVVLAHEMAHIRRGDFAGRMTGQVCLIVHFYHPIAYWLAGRLRLHQELAADARGLRLAGGRAIYLTTLARMALRHDAGGAIGPLRSRLAFDGSLLRRMDMLRDDLAPAQEPESNPWKARWATFGLIGLIGLALALATALAMPATTAADREVPAPSALAIGPKPSDEAPFDLSRVPVDAVGIVAVRPASTASSPRAWPWPRRSAWPPSRSTS